MRVFSRLSLTVRLTLVAIATLLPLLVLLVLSNLDKRDSQRREGERLASSYAQSVAASIDGFATELDAFMQAAALVLGAEPDTIDQNTASAQLRTLYSRYAEQTTNPDTIGEPGNRLTALFITDLQGRNVAQAAGDESSLGTDLSSRPYIKALQAGAETVWTGGLPGLLTGMPTAAYGRVIRDPSGAPRAFLVAAVRPGNIIDVAPPDLPRDANLVIVDHSGKVVVSVRNPDLVSLDVSSSPFVQTALNGQPSQIDAEMTPFDDGKRYGTITPIPHMGWVVAFTRSEAVLDASLRSGLMRELGAAAVVVALTIAGLIIAARQFSRPLRTLAAAASHVAAGERVDIHVTGADPDVAKLQAAFAAMTREVANREDRLLEQARTLQTLDEVGAWIASDLDFQKTIQAVTDAGTRLTEAEFGAFFYNVADRAGDSYQLYTLSGVDREAFAKLPMPRKTPLFEPIFKGEGPIRLDDVLADPRYGKMPPHFGMPRGHLPVRSYLAVPVRSGDGSVLGGLFFGHGSAAAFTERHEKLATGLASWAAIALDNARLYSDAQEIQENLRRANRAKDEFLGLVSHELRTPTTTIYGGIRILELRGEALSPETASELIHSMSEEASRLVRLIENLLTFARLELGQAVERLPIDINTTVRNALASPGRLTPGREVVQDLAPGLPRVLVEPVALGQVLQNLLSNADRYSPIDKPIQVQTFFRQGEVQVEISDSGPGVNPDELELIFESFYRSERSADLAGGQGLGLAVCKRLIEWQSGRIWAQNRPQGGLSVTFAFPAAGSGAPRDGLRSGAGPPSS